MKEDVLIYKDFIGTVHLSADDNLFYGRIEGVNDLVTFQGETVDELKRAFEEAVEDYVELCREAGKDPLKSFRGSFNVRIDPDLHRRAYRAATVAGQSLNQLVQAAIEREVREREPNYGDGDGAG